THFGGDTELYEEGLVQRLFHLHRDLGSVREFEASRGRGRARGRDRQHASIFGKVEAVLQHVVPEALGRERAIGKLRKEWLGEDRTSQRGDVLPDRVAEAHGLVLLT